MQDQIDKSYAHSTRHETIFFDCGAQILTSLGSFRGRAWGDSKILNAGHVGTSTTTMTATGGTDAFHSEGPKVPQAPTIRKRAEYGFGEYGFKHQAKSRPNRGPVHEKGFIIFFLSSECLPGETSRFQTKTKSANCCQFL